jgi:uncharacterized protein (AIM24 family)
MTNPQDNLPFEVVNRITRGGTTFEILKYKPLAGGESIAAIEKLYTLNRAEVHFYQLRIRLDNDAVRTEPGLLQFLKGHLDFESSTGMGEGMKGLMKGAIAAARTGETIFKPLYRGTGDIYLEPTLGHYWPMQLNNQTLYADQGLFCCCEDAVKVSAHKVESFSARVEKASNSLMGAVTTGEGLLQTFRGTGKVWIAPTQPLYELVASVV